MVGELSFESGRPVSVSGRGLAEAKGMAHMDPAKHMLDCVDPDAESAPAQKKTHDHYKMK